MQYLPDIYEKNSANTHRFALGMSGNNPLFVIGLNPSTADDEQADHTLKKVLGFVARNGFDGFIMLNLNSQRATQPEDLDSRVSREFSQHNLDRITTLFESATSPKVLAAWGATIEIRSHLGTHLKHIYSNTQHLKIKWLKIGSYTKKGHPRHPSRAPYNLGFTTFNLPEYLSKQDFK